MHRFSYQENLNGIDPARPLIYLWEVHDGQGRLAHCYVGQSISGKRPLKHYRRKIARLFAGHAYSRKRDKYRLVYEELGRASRAGLAISLTLLCNANAGNELDDREREYILRYNSMAGCGPGLNERAPPRARAPYGPGMRAVRPARKTVAPMCAVGELLEDIIAAVAIAYPDLEARVRSSGTGVSFFSGRARVCRLIWRVRGAPKMKLARSHRQLVWDGAAVTLLPLIASEIEWQ